MKPAFLLLVRVLAGIVCECVSVSVCGGRRGRRAAAKSSDVDDEDATRRGGDVLARRGPFHRKLYVTKGFSTQVLYVV